MSRFCPYAFAFMSILAVLTVFSGCAGASTPASAEPIQRAGPSGIKQLTQLIIKFRDPALDPSRQDYLQQLARDSGVTLVYVRPMSGDAHVFRVQDALDPAAMVDIVRRLSQRPDVEYAEPDYVMQHQMQQQ